MKQDNIIQDKSFEFALKIIGLYQKIVEQKEYILSKQLLRSGTSIGANIEEALARSSKKDFTTKMSISLKEARETRYWLRLYDASKLVDLDYSEYLVEIEDIINILTAIVKTSQTKI
jgi:four helix bundle protein